METVIEKRHKKRRAQIKAHFAKKRATAKAASAPKATPKASPASTAGKTISYFKGKSTVIDLGHKPSKAAITGAVSKLRAAKVSTKPKATPNSASKAPTLKIPAAAKADGSTQVLGRKYVIGAVAVSAAATAGAILAGSVTKLPKSKPTVKTPTGELAVQKGELKIKAYNVRATNTKYLADDGMQKRIDKEKQNVAKRHDARRAKQGTALRHAFEGAERADTRKAAELTIRHDARRAKQGAGLKSAFGAAARADARAKAPAERRSPANVTRRAEFDSAVKIQTAKNDAATAKAAAKPARAIEATGVGFYDEANLKKVDSRVAERRQGEATRRSKDRQTKAGATTESRARPIANQRGNRRKPSSDPRQGADAPKPKTNAQLQAEINVVKGEIAAKKSARTPADADMIKAEVKVSQAKKPAFKIETVATTPTKGAPKPVDRSSGGQAPITKTAKPDVVQVPKTAVVKGTPSKAKATPDGAEPKVTKAEAKQQYRELKLEAPKTVSEKQKKAADRKFFNQRSKKISEIVNPTKPSNVPGQVQATAADQGSKNEIQRRQNLKRIAELEIATAPKGPQKHTPQLKSPGDKANAAARAGVPEAEVARVARKIPTEKPAVKPSTAPKAEQIAKEIARVEAELKIPEVKTPKVGEQIPRTSPKTRVIPSVSSIKAEQATADTSKPVKAPKLHAPVETPVARDIVSNMKRFEQNQIAKNPPKPLTSPAIGTSKVKTTIKGGALLAGMFAALSGGKAAAAEHDPSKRLGKAKAAFQKEGVSAAKSIAGYSVASAVTGAVLGKAVANVAFRVALPVYGTYLAAKHIAIPAAKGLASAVGEYQFDKGEAARQKKISKTKYGTVEAATKTRHAKKAYAKAQAKNKTKDLLTG